ncbi:hypothetical protein [Gracilimonas mengyeensis]|uniref:Uncharacterized protein n=1 Tax=Gracilimonas mengyeensis TaxID=1302730 RepID=A0A521BJP9_9BACT|nr:hypothetical protein [Gracilimonas mengyeensis]SMO47313.1 hypothetical protein SAMN06265219_102336 [Gracilimonas mengyeensis]
MKFFRTHITRIYSVCTLLLGLLFCFIKPIGDDTSQDAFAFWLQSNLKTNSNSDVADQIRGLSKSESELESVIREASSLVKAHAEDFELPVDAQSKDEGEVFRVLLKEWNAYQHSSSGMGKAVIIKQAQPHSVLPVDGLTFQAKSLTADQQLAFALSGNIVEQTAIVAIDYHISPLSGGTAIGAP